MYSMPHIFSENELEQWVGSNVDHPLSTTQQHVAWENGTLRVECNQVRNVTTLEDRLAVRITRAEASTYPAVLISLSPDGKFHLVRRYRYAIGRWTLEFPRFELEDNDEGWKTPAELHLLRSTGLEAEGVSLIGAMQVDPALLDTSAIVLLAEGCRTAGLESPVVTDEAPSASGDEVESDDLLAGAFAAAPAQLAELIRRGYVTCGVTLAALSLYRSNVR